MFHIKYILISAFLVLPLAYGSGTSGLPTSDTQDTQYVDLAYGELPDHTFISKSLTKKWRECSMGCIDAIICTTITDMKGVECKDLVTGEQWTFGAVNIRWLRIHCQDMCNNRSIEQNTMEEQCYDDCIESKECGKEGNEEVMSCTDPGYNQKWRIQKEEFDQLISHCVSRCDPRPRFDKFEERQRKKCQARCKEVDKFNDDTADEHVSRSLDDCLTQCAKSPLEDKKLLWRHCHRQCRKTMHCVFKSESASNSKHLISCNSSLSDYHWVFKTEYLIEDFCVFQCKINSAESMRKQDEEIDQCYVDCIEKFNCEELEDFVVSCSYKDNGWELDKAHILKIICNDECGYQTF